MKRIKTICIVLLILVFTVGFDRVTKKIARDLLSDKPVYSYFYDTVRLVYVENTGAFLSFGANLPDKLGNWLFIAIPLVMMTALIIYIFASKKLSLPVIIAFSLIAGGGIGNLADRITNHRLVADFMNIGIGGFRTGIFNFADFFIMTGTSILILVSVFSKQAEKL